MGDFCSNCGHELTGGHCFRCGENTASRSLSVVGWILGVGLVLFVIGWAVKPLLMRNTVSGDAAQVAIAALPIRIPHSSALAQPAFTLGAMNAEWWTFTVTPDMSNAYIRGRFEAAGGSNDVRVLLLSPDELLNWRNGNQFRDYYDSGRVTTETLNVGPLAAGDYALVFSNRWSLMTPKAVTSGLELDWMQ